jgi:transposase
MGLTFQEIASRLQIGTTTAYRIFQRYVTTGDVAPNTIEVRPHTRKVDELHELYIIALIHENPAVYLSEICSKIKDTTAWIHCVQSSS